jgi:pSer/pThr/pTyr-binding forkhead associated (FHA) protein
VITCPKCGKENQDHYKFCLGCGSELPRSTVQAPRAFTAPTPPRGVPFPAKPAASVRPSAISERPPEAGAAPGEKQLQYARTQVRATEPAEGPGLIEERLPSVRPQAQAEAQPPETTQTACPNCGNPVPPDFKFCGTCGQKMGAAPEAGVAPAGKPVPPPAGKVTATAAAPARRGVLVLINPDGSEGSSFGLQADSTTIGRATGAPFSGDVYLSPVHATFTFKDNKLYVTDQGSLNGVYFKLERQAPTALEDGAIFRIGQEILKYEAIAPPKQVNGVELMGSPNPGYLGRVCTIIGRNAISDANTIQPDGMHIGRERGDVTFPDDGYVSGLHCRIHQEGNQVLLTDVGSSNGTFLRIRAEREVRNGELLLIGQQLFCVRY